MPAVPNTSAPCKWKPAAKEAVLKHIEYSK